MSSKSLSDRKRTRRAEHRLQRMQFEQEMRARAEAWMQSMRNKIPPTREEWDEGSDLLDRLKARAESVSRSQKTPQPPEPGILPNGTLYHEWGRIVEDTTGKFKIYKVSVPSTCLALMGWKDIGQWKDSSGRQYTMYRMCIPVSCGAHSEQNTEPVRETDVLSGGVRAKICYYPKKGVLEITRNGLRRTYTCVSNRTYRKILRALRKRPEAIENIQEFGLLESLRERYS